MSFYSMINKIKKQEFFPVIYEKDGKPEEFSAIPLSTYPDCVATNYESISELLETYYAKKNLYTRMRQKSVDLRKIVTNALERENKKYNLQLHQLKDTEKKTNIRFMGSFLPHTAIQSLPELKFLKPRIFIPESLLKLLLTLLCHQLTMPRSFLKNTLN